MKICLIGSSGHWALPLEALKERGGDRIVGLAPGSKGETMDAPALHCKKSGQNPDVFEDHRKMLDALKPDVVSLACRFSDQANAAIGALQRGCHVFMEKPVALSLPELETLKKAHSKAGTQLSTMLALRYAPSFLAAQQAVQRGAIGEVRLLTAQKSYKLGKRQAFYTKRTTYGGTIPWVGSHAIDLLAWFSGLPFKTVFATHSQLGNGNHGELEATALCLFTFGREVAGSVSLDYLRPSTAPTHGDDRIRVAGTEGVVEVREGQALIINGRRDGVQTLKPGRPRSFFGDFLKQIRGKGNCLVSAHDAFAMTEACLLARKSADEGKLISFKPKKSSSSADSMLNKQQQNRTGNTA